MSSEEESFLLPWVGTAAPDFPGGVAGRFALEVAPGHRLEGRSLRTVARRQDTDDVLFEVDADPPFYASVHLTWSAERETNPSMPWTRLYLTLEEWRQAEMLPDHEEFAR